MKTFETPDVQLVTIRLTDVSLGSNEFDIIPFSEENNLGIVSFGE